MVCAKHALILVGLGVLFLPAVALGQVQTPKTQTHTGVDPQALFNSNLQTLGKSKQEVASYRLMLSDKQSEAISLLKVMGMSGRELSGRTFAPYIPPLLTPFRDSSTGASEPSAKIQIREDRDQNDETFTVAIDGNPLPSGVEPGNSSLVEMALNDNDVAPTICLEISPDTVGSGEYTTVWATATTQVQNNDVEVEIDFASLSKNVDPNIFDDRVRKRKSLTIPVGKMKSDEFGFNVRFYGNEYKVSAHLQGFIKGAPGGVPRSDCLWVNLTIVRPLMVRLSASPKNPEEGDLVTITAEILNVPWVSRNVKVWLDYPNANTTDTAEPTDYTQLPSITINVGKKRGTGQIQTHEDNTDYDDETFTVAIDESRLAPAVTAGNPKELMVTIKDNDMAEITVPNAATVDEGSTTTVDVELAAKPTGTVTVTFSNDGNSDVSWSGTALSGDALTFTTADWNKAQTVTLTAADDDDFVNDTEILTLTASNGGYNGKTAEIMVTIEDDDAAGITVPGTATVTEGSTTTVDVKLAAAPTASMTVTFSDDGDSDVSWSGTALSGDALTFTDANWDIAQTVTLTAAEDDDFVNDTETLTLTAANGGYNGETANITVTITDNDAAGVTVPSTATVTEGSTTTVEVKLAAAPTANMTVTFSNDGDSDVSWSGTALSGNALTFTTTNWDIAQTVTLTAAEDDDFVNNTEALTLTAANGGYNGETANITVTITDNDAAGVTVPSTATVTEGSTTTVEVKLAAAPTANMTVTFSNDGDSDVSWSGTALSGNALTFTTTNWDIAQTVTLTAAEDDDFVNNTEALTLTAANGGYNGETANILVAVTDNDMAGIVVLPIVSLTEGNTKPVEVLVPEGGSNTMTVNLVARPTGDVSVTFSDDGDSDVSWSGTTLSGDVLTFTTANWNVVQTVTLTAAEDDDFVNDTEILTLTASNGGYNGQTAEVKVTITDDDTAGITAPSTKAVTEGSTTTVEVKLAAAPTADMTVTFSDDGDSDVSWSGAALSGDALTFTAANWDIAQTVTMTVAEDDDFVNDTETLTLTAANGGYNGETAEITVTITDNDAAGITMPSTATVTEGSTTTVDVKLAAAPTASMTVTLSDDGDSDMSWSGAALTGDVLTFTPQNWDLAQTVTLMAGEDDDFVDDTETLTLTASKSGGYNGETANITVTITDNDAAGIAVPNTATVTEGSTTIVEVTLAAAPTADMTVTFSDDGDSDVNWSGASLSGNALTFTTTNWNVAQTVTLTAAEDDDFVNNTEILTLTASKSGGYNGETAEITVTITDNDAAGIAVPNTATVTEGSTTTVDVKLAVAPTASVTVTFSDDGDSDLSWSGTTLTGDALTFTSTNWNEAQTVTLTAADDENFANDTEILTLTASKSGGYNGETANITVTIADNDAAGITVPNAATVTEGSTTTVDVKLAAPPTADMTVTFSNNGDSDVSWSGTALSGNALTFTTTNWNMTQAVTLTAAEDDDFVNDTETLTLTAKGGGYDGVGATITVTVTDNDAAAPTPVTVSLSASPNPVNEGGSVTITATLSEALSDAVTINLMDTPGEPPTEPGDYGSLRSITIAGGSRAGSGTLDIRDDDISEGEERFTVDIIDDLPSGVVLGSPSSVDITIADDDPPPPVEVTLFASPNPVNEGNSVTITARLTGVLETDVVVALKYSHDTSEPEDYTGPQSITISSGEMQGSEQIQTFLDADMENETFIVALGGNLPSEFLVAGRESSQFVTIRDITSPTEVAVDLSASPNPVDEGNGVTVTATLSEALDTDVEIPLTLTGGTANAQDYRAPIPVQVEIEAGKASGTYRISTVRDAVTEPDETFTVELGVLPFGLVKGDRQLVKLTITDDDEAGIEALPSVSVAEGEETSFGISLTSEPLDEVEVTMSWPAGTDLTVHPIIRIFTPENWNETQQVTLSAADDADIVNDQVEVLLTASGGGYDGISKMVSVTITDSDTPGIVVNKDMRIEEGGTHPLMVRLSAQPSGTVTVTFTGHSRTDLTLDQSLLTFTTSDWDTPKTVTLTAAEDDDFVDDTETLTLTASGGGYAGVTTDITVTITDNDAPGLVAPEVVQMEEGGTHPLLIRLSASPPGPVTLTFTGHAGTDLILNQPSLTFTATDWNTSKTVTLTAEEDDEDYADETVGLKVTASGGGYDGVTTDITVTIMDNDERPGPLTITLYDEQALEHAEAIQLPIELSRPVDQVVTVQYASTAGTAETGLDYVTSRGIVIFDPGATRGVIEIEVIDDELPEEHETFMVTLSKPRNAIIARETGTGTILDDDGASAILRVEDALVLEEEGMVRFRVLLSHPQHQMISAAYRTRDGTAKAGEDYEASSGVVTLAPGTVEAMIAVPLLKDGLDWREETFTVHLESSKHAEIAKAVGVATIQESTTVSEEVLEAYAARFVRTSGVQVVEALGERFRSGADGAACGAVDRAEMARIWYSASSWDPSLGELLAGCRMSATSYSGSFSVWGRGAFRQFNGRDDDALTLRGEVTTGMLGADYRWRGGWLAGLLLAHSQGEGSFEVVQQSGEITAGLTGVYPYVSYARAGWDVWMSAGAGRGQAEVLELKGDLVSRFGAMGVRGKLMSSGTIGLNYHGDVLVTDAEIKDHEVTAEVYRVRAGVEANVKISDGLRPFLEANVRSDGGSAETGVGLEFGGGIRVAYPAWRLQADLRTQGLVMHTADGFTEWGISGSVQVGSQSEGLMMRVRPSWGRGQGMSMYGQQTILDAVPLGADAQRTELELGYGVPWKGGTARSVMGVTQLHQGVMYRLGGELHPSEWLTFSVFGLAHGRAAAPGDIGVNVRGSLRY